MHNAVDARELLAPVADAAALDELVARSYEEPVLLFNYDPFCPINASARWELERLGADVAVVDVARQHDLGQLVATRTGVRHESPQVIVLRAGRAAWSASHFRITADAVRGALDAARRADPETPVAPP